MVNHVTLAVGKGFEEQLSYLVKGFGVSTLMDGIPSTGVGGFVLWEDFCTLAESLIIPENTPF
jgi:hypothetical protein